MLRMLGSMLVASMLVVGTAHAQTESAYGQLPPGNKMIVDALYQAQQPQPDALPISRDELAFLESGGGWGKAFKDLKDAGYYPDYKNFGQVVSSHNRSMHQARTSDKAAASDARRADQGVRNVSERSRVERHARIKRAERPNRPHRVRRPRR